MSPTPVKGSAPVVPVPATAVGTPLVDVGMQVASVHPVATSDGMQSSVHVVPSVVVGTSVVVVVVVVGTSVVVDVVVGVSVVVVVVGGGVVFVDVVVELVSTGVGVLDEVSANADGAQARHSANVTNTGRSRFTIVSSSTVPK